MIAGFVREIDSTAGQVVRAAAQGQARNLRSYRSRLETLRERLRQWDPNHEGIARATAAIAACSDALATAKTDPAAVAAAQLIREAQENES